MIMKKIKLFISLLLTLGIRTAYADVVPNTLFNENAVLQRNAIVPIWGTAREGEQVTVAFAGQQVTTTTGHDGKWLLKLQPLKAGGPFTMVITGDNTLTFSNVLVGEVWVCSGQSNMAMVLAPRAGQIPILNWEAERDQANYPQIRQFRVSYNPSGVPVASVNAKWMICSPQTVGDFSAVAYFFASDLHRKLKVPIGLLFSAVGGTPAEFWTSYTALNNTPEQKRWALAYDRAVKQYPIDLEKYQQAQPALLEKYNTAAEQAKKDNKPLPKKPAAPQDPAKTGAAGGLYNGMIAPLQPYAVKGIIWYQGESNDQNAVAYQSLFSSMIADWRKGWGQGNIPFLFVQIAPYKGLSPWIRDAQLQTWRNTPNTAMVVTTDCGEEEDIHPKNKRPVGDRLALAASVLAYGEKTEYSGPLFQSLTVNGSQAVLRFTHYKKLVAKGGPLKGFVIAGSDGNFVPATAEIKGKTIVVYSPEVQAPVAVRYGWVNTPDVNLYNEKELPASPFRTDTQQKL